jgi:hypothetical protein
VRRIESNARGLGGLPSTTDPSAGEAGDAGDPCLLVRLRRADEALRVVVRHGSVETFRAGEVRKAEGTEEVLPPGARELIALRDEALLAMESEHTTAKQVADRFFRGIGEVLEAEGIGSTEPSETLDPARQHVIGTRPTADPALHGRIAEIVGPGYVFHGRVIRPEQVVTWRKTRSAASAVT